MSRRRRAIGTAVFVAVAALVLSACAPKPGGAPASVNCNGISGGSSWVLEYCHSRYRAYGLDQSSSASQTLADWLAANRATCANLGAYHSSGNQLLANYPGARSVAENLYCYSGGPGTCPSAQFGATKAMNGWIASPGHKANLDNFAGAWVNAAARCNQSTGYYFAVAQFHR